MLKSTPIIVFPDSQDAPFHVNIPTITRSTYTTPLDPPLPIISTSSTRSRATAISSRSPGTLETATFEHDTTLDDLLDESVEVERMKRAKRRYLLPKYRLYRLWAVTITTARKFWWLIGCVGLAYLLTATYIRHLPQSIDETVGSIQETPASTTRFTKIHAKNEKRIEESVASKVLVKGAGRLNTIESLMGTAAARWETKLAAQSRTLKAAVDEYQRRYGRLPPRGFDQWWYYCLENNIQLVDEYDQIHRDLHLFRAISPFGLKKRMHELQKAPGMFTLYIKDRQLHSRPHDGVLEIRGATERIKAQMDLLAPFVSYLEDGLQILFNIHDYPRVLVPNAHQSELTDRIEDGEYWNEEEAIDTSGKGFTKACPPSSLIVRQARHSRKARTEPVKVEKEMFITNWRDSMDVCNNPEYLEIHGSFAGRRSAHTPLEPIFSLAKTTAHGDILSVPMDYWGAKLPTRPWAEKTKDELFWRGKTTGNAYSTSSDWTKEHRFRLVALAEGKEASASGATVNQDWLDIGFVGEPAQCDDSDGTCKQMKNRYKWHPRSRLDTSEYKYVIDVDGNAWSARFKRLMDSNSLVFKSTVYPEWWTDRIEPWYHFVPTRVDYSDLADSLDYFRKNDQAAEMIANNGTQWAQSFWREADMKAYAFRLYLEWQRLLGSNRSKMDFEYNETMERLS